MAVNQQYLELGELDVQILGRGYACLDIGTCEAMNKASQFVEVVELRQGLKVAWRKGWITEQELLKKADELKKNGYGQYLKHLVD